MELLQRKKKSSDGATGSGAAAKYKKPINCGESHNTLVVDDGGCKKKKDMGKNILIG